MPKLINVTEREIVLRIKRKKSLFFFNKLALYLIVYNFIISIFGGIHTWFFSGFILSLYLYFHFAIFNTTSYIIKKN